MVRSRAAPAPTIQDKGVLGSRRRHRLRAIRESFRLSQVALGRLCHPPIKGSTINKLEHFQMEMTFDYLYRLSEALQLPRDEFFIDPSLPRLPPDVERLVQIYRGLSESDRVRFRHLAEAFGESAPALLARVGSRKA